MNAAFQSITRTPSVLAAQRRYYQRSELPISPAWQVASPLGQEEMDFIHQRDSFYLATVNETGWPYLQHRGGPRGFLRCLDAQTLAFADFGGNRQLITVGNLASNDRVALFLMDYDRRERLKLLGRARVVAAEEDPGLAQRVADPSYRARIERVFVIQAVAFDWNCPQHITPRHGETPAAQCHDVIRPSGEDR